MPSDFTYDLLSRSDRTSVKPTATESTWTVTELIFDDDSRTTTRRVCNNPGTYTDWQETQYVYDERNRRITLRRADGDIWNYQYDANSNVLGWDDPLGPEWNAR